MNNLHKYYYQNKEEDQGPTEAEALEVEAAVNWVNCSSHRVCGNKGCMHYGIHVQTDICELQRCPIVGRDVKCLS